MLITPAPISTVATQRPALLNSAVVRFGFCAPQLITGTHPASGARFGPPDHGVNAAGYIGRSVASLPAATTIATPNSPSRRIGASSIGSNVAESSRSSW